MDLVATIKALKDVIIKKKLLANDNRDLSSIVKAAAFCRTLKQKEKAVAVPRKIGRGV